MDKEEKNPEDLKEICEYWFEVRGEFILLVTLIQRNNVNITQDF